MRIIVIRPPFTWFTRGALLLPFALLVGMTVAAQAAARCATDIVSVEQTLRRAAPPAVARARAQHEIEAARQAPSEQSCRRHLETAMRYIRPDEPVAPRRRAVVPRNCDLDPSCPNEAQPGNDLTAIPGRFGGRRCRGDGTCSE
jgi:hypothetical protein